MAVLTGTDGQTYRTQEELARGGEGIILTVQGYPDYLVKCYLPGQANEVREAKLRAMLADPPRDEMWERFRHASITWPTALLAEGGRFVGYLMPRIEGGYSLLNAYNPRARAALGLDWHAQHQVAKNLCTALHALHAKGYIMGDVNPRNILVTARGLVTLVDTDSFQVRADGILYRCPVGVPEYTPRELQRLRFAGVDRTEEHDRFGLAVLLFQLLMDGFHPFAGALRDPTDSVHEKTDEWCITHGVFPWLRDRRFRRPPAARALDSLDPGLRELFVRCFVGGHLTAGLRPTPKEWLEVLTLAQQRLVRCAAGTHWRYPEGTDCHACRSAARRRPLPRSTAPRSTAPRSTAPRSTAPRSTAPRSTAPRSTAPRSQALPSSTSPQRSAAPSVSAGLSLAWTGVPPPPPARSLHAWSAVLSRWTLGRLVAVGGGALLLLVGAALYYGWSTQPQVRAASYVAQARQALAAGDDNAAEQALQQAMLPAPDLVAAFARDRADLYRELARRAQSRSEPDKATLALAEAQHWDAKARAAKQLYLGSGRRRGPVGGIGDEMVELPGGSFLMGCSPGYGRCADDARPAHRVTVQPFRLGRYEVTQAQWKAVMDEAPVHFRGGERPVEGVSAEDVQEFLKRLNAQGPGQGYRLPSEAEWEYAVRAGNRSLYWWGEAPEPDHANCDGCGGRWDGKETAPVGSFKPNGFGLYDLAGNVAEWVQDCYHGGYAGAPLDGSVWRGTCVGSAQVFRGGSWADPPSDLGSANRFRAEPSLRSDRLGFRLAQDL